MRTFEDRISSAVVWYLALVALLVMLSGCSAAIDLPTKEAGLPATATAQPSATATTLTDLSKSVDPSPAPQCTVNAGKVYLRKGAGMSYGVITVLHAGQSLTVIEHGEWIKVETSQRFIGWVYGRYCKVQP